MLLAYPHPTRDTALLVSKEPIMWGELVEDVLRRLDAEEKLPGAVSSLVLASLLGEIEECLGGQLPKDRVPT